MQTIRKTQGIAGQVSYSVDTDAGTITFVGSEVYGGPVVMITGKLQTFVTDPGRFGNFGKEWIERFLAS
jgi:hypothetical protein